MSSLSDMPLDTSAYLADTGHLKTIEHGAYLLILFAMWRSSDGWIPGDDNYLARTTRLTLGRWKAIAATVRKLLSVEGDRISQKRIQKNKNANPGEDSNFETKSLKSNDVPIKKARNGKNGSLSFFEEKDSEISSEKKKKGCVLPASWHPRDEERLYGRTVLHLSDSQIDVAAEKMRRWAISNAHRQVARKSNWEMTFRNWLDDAAEKFGPPPPGPRGPQPQSKKSGNGFAAVTAKLMQQRKEREEEHDEQSDDAAQGERSVSAGSAGGVLEISARDVDR